MARRINLDARAMLVIAAVVVVAHLMFLTDLADPNPLGPYSKLATTVSGRVGQYPVIDPNIGFTSQALGHRAMLDLAHLHLPWWNPYEGTGTPLAGEMQSGALFPPTLLLLMSNGQLYEHMLLEIVAGIATYLLLRRLRIGELASLAGGVAFALNGTFAWMGHATVNPIAFLPLLLLGIERGYAAARDGNGGGWRLIALAGALSFYGGFPEVAYIDSLLALLWFTWRVGCLERSRRRSLLAKGALGAVGGVLLSAPLAIAALDYLQQGDVGPHASAHLGSVHLLAQSLPQLLAPYVYGPIFRYDNPQGTLTSIWSSTGGYLGASLVMFAFLGCLSRGRSGLRIMLGIWIVLAFARIYGQIPLLGHVIGVLPGMAHIEFYRFAQPAFELAVIVLAALGIDEAIHSPSRRRVAVAGLAAGGLVVGAAVGARSLTTQLSSYPGHHYFVVSIGWAMVSVAVPAVVILATRRPTIRGPLLALAIAVDVAALFVVPELAAPRAVHLDNAPIRFLQRHLGDGRVFALGPLQPNYGSYYGLQALNINDNPIPQQFADYVHAHLDQYVYAGHFVGNGDGGRSPTAPSTVQELERNLPGYRAAGVSYVMAEPGQALPQGAKSFMLVLRTPTAWIYRVPESPSLFTATSGCSATAHGTTSATVRCATTSRLIYRETAMPGWSAHVDGRSAPEQTVSGLFQSVAVPAGAHTVDFTYRPPKILWGELAFVLGLLAMAAPPLRRRLHPGRSGSHATGQRLDT